MHRTIFAIVPGDEDVEAVGWARTVFDKLIDRSIRCASLFDEYHVLTEHRSPRDRDDTVKPVPLNTDEGLRLYDDAWETTKQDFEENLAEIRCILDSHTNEEIQNDVENARYPFLEVGLYRGPPVRLYDWDACGIREPSYYRDVRDRRDDYWIVPADVHY